MSSVELLSVDLQHEFASPGGGLYRPRGCVPFLTDVVFPTARMRQWRVHEIVSDYRDPAKPSTQWHCAPGRWAGESLVPRDVLGSQPWVKATPSPAWTRSGAGDERAEPGPAEPDPHGFTQWLGQTIGRPDPQRTVVVVGLMLGVCVLSTLQELTFRGYRPSVHEHACARCRFLRVDPAQLPRILDMINNTEDRLQEARDRTWLGEVAALEESLQHLRRRQDEAQSAADLKSTEQQMNRSTE